MVEQMDFVLIVQFQTRSANRAAAFSPFVLTIKIKDKK
jgi:hypothetical protein